MFLKKRFSIIFISIMFFLLAVVIETRAFSQGGKGDGYKEVQVVTAVAPTFNAFIFGKTGENKITVEAKINGVGEVVSASIVDATFLRDRAVESTARQWKFSHSKESGQLRTVRIIFVFEIMPKETPLEDLTTTYNAPYEIVVRHKVFDPYISD